MRHGTESSLCAMLHSTESWLCTMPHSAEFFIYNFICDSALCNLGLNSSQKFSCWLHALPHSAELRLQAMRHSAESTHICEFLCEFTTICKNILTRWSVNQVGLIFEKTESAKSRETVPLI
jgi:hypothetical protein